jgi:hypothetical protein
MLELYYQSNKGDFTVTDQILKFSYGNRKLKKMAVELGLPKNQVVGFDLPAGHTCPFADKCKAKADRVTGKITDGKNTVFRCYASSGEARSTNARNARWHNYDLIKGKTTNEIAELILSSLPDNVKIVRIHSSGDFFAKYYFNAWVKVAFNRPNVHFFGYTKAIQYVDVPKPDNFKLIYSFGGKLDHKLTDQPVSYVVNNLNEAQKLGVPVACQKLMSDDYTNIMQGVSFALLIHGTQPAKCK